MKQRFAITLLAGLLITGCANQNVSQSSSQPQSTTENARQKEIRLLHEYLQSNYNPQAKAFDYQCAGADYQELLALGKDWSHFNFQDKYNLAYYGIDAWYTCSKPSGQDAPIGIEETIGYLDDLFKSYPEDQQSRFMDVIRALYEFKQQQ